MMLSKETLTCTFNHKHIFLLIETFFGYISEFLQKNVTNLIRHGN